MLIHEPILYEKGIKKSLFNYKIFLKWLFIGFWQSILIGTLSIILNLI